MSCLTECETSQSRQNNFYYRNLDKPDHDPLTAAKYVFGISQQLFDNVPEE